jgi:hypothetical protein
MLPSQEDNAHDSLVVCAPGSAHCRSSCRLHDSCFLDMEWLRIQRAYPSHLQLKELAFQSSHSHLAFLGILLHDGNDMHPREHPSNALDTMLVNPCPLGQDDFGVAFPGASYWVHAFVQSQGETRVDDHHLSFAFDPVSPDLWSCPIHHLLSRLDKQGL